MATMSASLIYVSCVPQRFMQLIAATIALVASADLQYAWINYPKPIQAHQHVSLTRAAVLYRLRRTWKLRRDDQ
jgi:hypothetical protein